MFEKEIKFISDFSLNQVKYLGQQFTFEKVLTTELHPAIIQYISAELDFMIFADRRKLMQMSFFDYSGKEISYHFKKISDEIKKTKIISLEDVKKLIIQAVSFNANYVVRPKWSLTKLIYNDQSTISVDELEIMLSYIYYYDYIRNVLTGYLIKRKVVQLSLSEFDLILNRIDRELFKTNSERLIDNALSSIGDFFNIGGVDKTLVSPTAIEILFKEKNLVEMITKLHKVIPAQLSGEATKKNLEINEIKRILYSPDTVQEESKEKEEVKSSDEAVSESSVKIEEEEPAAGGTTQFEIKSKSETSEIPSSESVQSEEKTIGELAELHAEELEKSGTTEFLTREEEETLLSLYNEDMAALEKQQGKESGEGVESETGADIPKAVEENQPDELKTGPPNEQYQTENKEATNTDKLELEKEQAAEEGKEEMAESSVINHTLIDQKEIVNEMISDYFGGATEVSEAGEQEEEIESKPERGIDSLEEELFEVFEELDKLDNSIVIEEELVEDEQPNSNLINATETNEHQNIDTSSAQVEAESTVGELEKDSDSSSTSVHKSVEGVLDELEKDLKTIDEIVFTDEEIVTDLKPEEKPVVIETPKPEDNSPLQEQFKNHIKERSGFQEIPSPTMRKREQESPVLSIRKTRKKDLFSYLKRKEIQKIISNIFGKDEEDFVNTTERIMECASYKEASDILKSVFNSYKISPYSKEAVNLANAVSNYFRQA